MLMSPNKDGTFLVPRGRDLFGQHQKSRPLVWPNPILKACAEHSFCIFSQSDLSDIDNESVNRGLPVLEPARGLDSWC